MWQPIETRVEDGRYAIVGCWVDGSDYGLGRVWSQWFTILDGGPLGNDGMNGDEPTHWRDAPPPPQD